MSSTPNDEHDGSLIGVTETAHIGPVPNDYDSIKQMLRGGTLDFLRVSETAGFYIDDNGMINGSKLNFAASIFAGRVIYGPVVMTAAFPDAEGDTLPPRDEDIALMMHFCMRWHAVEESATQLGQNLDLVANADTVPPPQMIPLTDEAFDRWLNTGEVPDGS